MLRLVIVLFVLLLNTPGCRSPVASNLPKLPEPLSRSEVSQCVGTNASDVLSVLKSRQYIDVVQTEDSEITPEQLNECGKSLIIRPEIAAEIRSVIVGKRIDPKGGFVTEVNEVWFYCDRDGTVLGAGAECSSHGF